MSPADRQDEHTMAQDMGPHGKQEGPRGKLASPKMGYVWAKMEGYE